MGVTVEIEVAEIRNRVGRSVRAFAGGTPVGPRHRRRSRSLAFLSDDDGGRRLQGDALATVDSGQHLLAGGPRRQAYQFGQEVIGERLSRVRGPDLQLAVQRVRYIPDLDHLGHAITMRACWTHVKAQAGVVVTLLDPK